MIINHLSKKEFLQLVYADKEKFLERIHKPQGFVVRQFYPGREILNFRNKVFDTGLSSEPSWHPLLNDCPDYHRVHDNYPQAYVKGKMHAFYFHGWYEKNFDLFNYFDEIFALKCFLGDLDKDAILRAQPSSGVIARVNLQNYPSGGGGLSEHVDPYSNFALIQTLIQGSSTGKDFKSGGLFAREQKDSEKVYLDHLTEPGDLIVLSPAIPHGVDPVDPNEDYDWKRNKGKWTILPIIVSSDYPSEHKKPKEI